jgi:hypothetical protein
VKPRGGPRGSPCDQLHAEHLEYGHPGAQIPAAAFQQPDGRNRHPTELCHRTLCPSPRLPHLPPRVPENMLQRNVCYVRTFTPRM